MKQNRFAVGMFAGAMFLAPVGASADGEIKKLNVKSSLDLTEVCTPIICVTSLKANGGFTVEATITDADTAQFGPDTILDIQPGVITASQEFRLGDDPNYQPGDTSVSFSETLDFDGLALNSTTKISWAKGKFKVKVKFKGKDSATASHLDLLNSPPKTLLHTISVKDKTHDPILLPVLLKAENSEIVFWEAGALGLPEFTQATIFGQKAAEGEATNGQQSNMKAKEFINVF